MKIMLVFSSGLLYGILEREHISQFLKERDMNVFEIVKTNDKKGHLMVEKLGKEYDDYLGYPVGEDRESIIIFPDEELYLLEGLDQKLIELKSIAGSIMRIMMEDLKLNGDEETLSFGYMSQLNKFMSEYNEMEKGIEDIDFLSYAKHQLQWWGMKQ